MPSKNSIGFDCLYHWVADNNNLPKLKADTRIVAIRFCRQSTIHTEDQSLSIENSTITNGKQWTFSELRQMNISARQLVDWYAPLDLIEEYLLEKEIGIFVNCSRKKHFGPRCQYSFDSAEELKEIIWNQFDTKYYSQNDVLSVTNGTCYMIPNNQCQSILCLDWREICD
ncbi:unnamed protein product, partial [Adineta ricciae]